MNVFNDLAKLLDNTTNVYEVKVTTEFIVEVSADNPTKAKEKIDNYLNGKYETNGDRDKDAYNDWLHFINPDNLIDKKASYKIFRPKYITNGDKNEVMYRREKQLRKERKDNGVK